MHPSRSVLLGAAVAAFLCAGATIPAQAKKGDSWSLNIGAVDHASPRDVGLPLYPGARKMQKNDGDEDAAHVWALWGSAGLKVAVIKLVSHDSPRRIAAFYRPALGKYGPVLDCTGHHRAKHKHGKGSDKLTCDDNDTKPGEMLFKSGTNREQHIVAVKPEGHGTEIDLVYVRVKGFD